MKMILLGTGTSHGIPCIACHCHVCTSKDSRDKRFRCSAYVTNQNKNGTVSHLQIDTGPEFRLQCIKYGIENIDAVLLTHSHADHLHGLDDIRVFSHTLGSDKIEELKKNSENAGIPPKMLENSVNGRGICLYANSQTIEDVKSRFSYIFKQNTQVGGGKPKLTLVDCAEIEKNPPAEFGDLTVVPVPLKHGALDDSGWLISCRNEEDGKIHSIAYLTDTSFVPPEGIQLLKEKGGIIEHCVIDGLRVKPHSTHFGFRQAMEVAEQIKPRHTWFVHICHLMTHVEIQEYAKAQLPDFPNLCEIVKNGGSVEPGYDGLVLEA